MTDAIEQSAVTVPANVSRCVIDMIVQGATTDDVVSYGVREWGWSGDDDPRAGAAVEAACLHFQGMARMEADLRIGLCLDMYRDIYRRAGQAGDLPTQLRAVKEIAALPTGANGAD